MTSRHRNRTFLIVPVLGALALLSSGLAPSAQDSPCNGEGTERSSFVSLWQSAYPNSQSLNHVINGTGRACQLCHRDSGGSDPDNGYGWAIRQELDGGASFATALAIVGAADSDGDGTSNVDEITSGTQPEDGGRGPTTRSTCRAAASRRASFRRPGSWASTTRCRSRPRRTTARGSTR